MLEIYTIYNKKVIKTKGISVVESLTARRIKMLEKARELHRFLNVWSVNVYLWLLIRRKVNGFYK